MKYFYATGEEVRIGDRVYTENQKIGVVVKVIVANSKESTDFNCPQGGVMIDEDWNGVSSWTLFTDERGILSDLQLIERKAEGEEASLPDGPG